MLNRDLVKYIASLSKNDIKTLSQKALKTCEEAGELASVVLPFEGAPSTNHRFVSRHDVLEEVADVLLCVLSISYSLGFKEEDLERMVADKAAKWAALQESEAAATNKRGEVVLPFELHVTCEVPSEREVEFDSICAALNSKRISLSLVKSDGQTEIMRDVMTETRLVSTNTGAFEELATISNGFRAAGYKVIREKAEAPIYHPAAPTRKQSADHKELPAGQYFESHFSLDIEFATTPLFLSISRDLNLALAANSRRDTQTTRRFVATLRSTKGNREAFGEDCLRILKGFAETGIEILSEQREFAIYDSNSSHDLNWLVKQ